MGCISLFKKFGILILAFLIIVSGTAIPIFAADKNAEAVASEQFNNRVKAFKGAEGAGMYSKGARAALDNDEDIKVVHVTNLNDSGPGSFRDAVSGKNRIVVFDVSGYIDLLSRVSIGDNTTVLGQTAPGDGVCFRSNDIKIGGDNVILRYIKGRVGSKMPDGTDTICQDGLEITDDCTNVIVDHCSISWGTDENLSAYCVKNVTLQWCIISEALNQSIHAKGEHSYASLWGGKLMTIHHCLVASHKSRNPRISSTYSDFMPDEILVDLKNNLFYNWGDKSGYGGEDGAVTYITNNVYKPGPATPAKKRTRIFELSAGQKLQPNLLGRVYANGNKILVDENDSDYKNALLVNANNWQDELHTGVYIDPGYRELADTTRARIYEPEENYNRFINDYPIALDDTDDVYEKVINGAGARLPKLDKVDERIISNVENSTAPSGSKGSVGLLDDPLDGVPADDAESYDDRGYPFYKEESRPSDYDADGDGIADDYEDKVGLDKNNPYDSTSIGPDGLTWLEIYVEEELTKSDVNDLNVELEPVSQIYTNEDSIPFSAKISGTGAVDVDNVEFYCGENLIAKTNNINNGIASIDVSGLPTGDNKITAKAIKGDGTYQLSSAKQLCVTGAQSAEGWNSVGNAAFDGVSYTLPVYNSESASLTREASGDFELVARVDNISNLKADNKVGISLKSDNNSLAEIYKGIDVNYNPVIYYHYADGKEMQWKDNKKDIKTYNLIKISHIGKTVSIYAGTNLAEWEKVTEFESDYDSFNVSARADGKQNTVSKLGLLQLVTEKTNPAAKIINVSNNDRLSYFENIEVKVAPDKSKKITDIFVYLNSNIVASKSVNITEESTIIIPTEFTSSQKGVLSVYCFDENTGTGSDSVDIVVSQNAAPWIIQDIGNNPDDVKAYVTATGPGDYTYKLASDSSGNIGGKSDKFGYLCQEFTGDNRIYYRSRMQDSKQFGIVLKNDLSADGVTYFFGGIVDDSGSLSYKLMKRESIGEEMTVVEDFSNILESNKTLFLAVEKFGDVINIYRTENTSETVFKNKELIASVKCDGLNDRYYMGFGTVSLGSNPADAGWVATENVTSPSNGTRIQSYEDGIVTISRGDDFTSGTVIACGYDSNGFMIDEKHADISEDSVNLGTVSGENYKILLWNNMNDMVPLCEPYDGTAVASDANCLLWNFDYGLDWFWQMQAKLELQPEWSTENIGGNTSGKMKISTGNDYGTERYIFHEYVLPDNLQQVVTGDADVYINGDDPAVNMYLQVKGGTTAFRVTFSDDGQVYFGDIATGYKYNKNAWYHISINCDSGKTGGESADYILKDSTGNVCASNSGISSVTFRNQKNIEKKLTVVTNAFYIEPVAGKTAEYYIDNVSVSYKTSETQKNVVDSHFWDFGSDAALSSYIDGKIPANTVDDGLTIVTGGDLQKTDKSVDGITFKARFKLGGAGSIKSKCVKFDVPAGTTDIIVYGEPGGSSGVRSVVINDGKENKYELKEKMSVKYTYTGDAKTIYIYGDSGINLYGIQFETYTY